MSVQNTEPQSGHRIDVAIHQVLTGSNRRPSLIPAGPQEGLPEPVFPQRPDLLGDVEPDPKIRPVEGESPYRRRWEAKSIHKAMRGWLYPYVRSRVLPGDFHPIIAYLFTEWKCNLDCHYCWAFDNSVKGMTEEVARRSIDWLADHGNGVLALMGGEVLLRPEFAHKVVYHGTKKGMWVYVPTNGRLLRPDVTDRLGDAGVATVNFAVDVVDEKPGLPKALAPIRKNFEYLIRKQYSYGFSVFFNINICRNNIDDVKRLTGIAHDHGIATDYHINESPMLDQPQFKHQQGNDTFIRREDWPAVDALVDWLKEKNRSGHKMVNSVARLEQMKHFLRGAVEPWQCRAGHNSLIIRVDGTLAPCFPMYSATYDWGVVGGHRFETPQLREMKRTCESHCFSTLNHNLAYCYNDSRAIHWVLKQARRGFQGVTGSFE